MGVTVFAAAGDDGSTDGIHNGRSHADFPASSPNVVACGGTRLPNLDRDLETAWNDMPKGGATGGAVSDFWATPGFQQQVKLPVSANDGKTRRTIPDVSADAAPGTGYRIFIDGNWYVFGGTSAVAPLMAGMAGVLTQRLQAVHPGKRLGDFNALLYGDYQKSGALRQINDGSTNGHYKTAAGYNAVVGLGTPNFDKMVQITTRNARSPQPPSQPKPKLRTPRQTGNRGLAA